MVKDIYSFSDCGQYFAYSGPDGKLKLWETSAGTLKQEYVPNLHLSSPCTALIWISIPISSVSSSWKNRKRKLDGKQTKIIVIGTGSGVIALYSFSEGKVIQTLEGGHNTTVHALSWSKEQGLFSIGDNFVINWDLANACIKSKWKCSKGRPTCLAVSPKGDLCVTGSYDLSLWDVEKQSLIKTFTGHSSEITHIQFVNQQYFISAASNDRHISTWNVHGESTDPIGRFALSDSINSDISISENMGSLHLGAATRNGCLHYFNHQLNGKIGKSIKPKQTVEIATDPKESSKVSPLPILSVKLTTPTTAHIVYGYSPQFSFETINITEGKENRICLIRTENVKPVLNNSVKVGGEATENVEYVSASTAVKRKSVGKNEIPMEERLGNLSIDYKDLSGTNKQSPFNMSQLLIQGLESKDKTILDSVLMRRDPEVIQETVSRLPIQVLTPLLQELKNKLQGKTLCCVLGSAWLKAIMRVHASQLIADSSACELLASVQSHLETRLSLLGPLSSLQGRLGQVLHQIEAPQSNFLANMDPVVLYQDEESSEDGESLMNDVDADDSEERWDELSDQEIDSGDES
ncbi:WD repeat-containing protein 43 [Cimex lectularius]|uniref:Small-subunit processome Utp12 domain-containing protein n=1 Tax=Cimex lectularius TaxID=79782 RepID=A0A8I6S4G8_CIMLE|nr:WD repeat-containing protein 43 [Cimex lectularius]